MTWTLAMSNTDKLNSFDIGQCRLHCAAVMIQFVSYKACIYQVEIIIALVLDNLTVNILNQAEQNYNVMTAVTQEST